MLPDGMLARLVRFSFNETSKDVEFDPVGIAVAGDLATCFSVIVASSVLLLSLARNGTWHCFRHFYAAFLFKIQVDRLWAQGDLIRALSVQNILKADSPSTS